MQSLTSSTYLCLLGFTPPATLTFILHTLCPEEAIITQGLEHFHGWGLNMATKRERTFALEKTLPLPKSSRCLVCDKKEIETPCEILMVASLSSIRKIR